MHRLPLIEYGRFPRAAVPAPLLRRLQAFDEQHARICGDCIFDWSRVHHVSAKSYVGVIQIPGLQVEILPKNDHLPDNGRNEYRKDSPLKARAQTNLLFMFAMTRKLPILPRELASLRIERIPMIEALMRVFAQRLLEELRKGLDHTYVYREENGCFFRGKLLVSQHIRHNAAQHQRCYVGFEEFMSDTWLNRILKAACLRLLATSRWAGTQQRLREAVLVLADVESCPVHATDFDRVQLSRNTDRFAPLLDFAKLVLLGNTPAPAAGEGESFSLLFPMETLFEEFIAHFIQCHSREIGLDRSRVHAQAVGRRRWL